MEVYIKIFKIYILLTTICCLNLAESRSHVGKEFYFGVLHNYHEENQCTSIYIDIASSETGSATLSVPFLSITRNLTINQGITSIPLSCSLAKMGSFTEMRSVILKSNVNISVYATNYFKDSTGTFMVLPKQSIGFRYRSANYQPYASTEESYIMIVPTQKRTQISIFDNANVFVRNYSLAESETAQFALSFDQTSYFVKADQPVAVISGTSCSNIPQSVSACDMLIQQVVPERSLGNKYIVPALVNIGAYELRVLKTNLSKENTLCLTNHTQSICSSDHTVFSGLFRTDPTVVIANLSVSVFQYSVGRTHPFALRPIGDPFMTVIPGLHNYLNHYDFAIPDVYRDCSNLISVIIQRKFITGLYLDGKSFSPGSVSNVSAPLNQYMVLTSNVTTGFHVLKHNDSSVLFGLLVYGHGVIDSEAQGYGYPAGLNLSDYYDDSDVLSKSDSPEQFSTTTIPPSMSTTWHDMDTTQITQTRHTVETDGLQAFSFTNSIHTTERTGTENIRTTPSTSYIQTTETPGTADIRTTPSTSYIQTSETSGTADIRTTPSTSYIQTTETPGTADIRTTPSICYIQTTETPGTADIRTTPSTSYIQTSETSGTKNNGIRTTPIRKLSNDTAELTSWHNTNSNGTGIVIGVTVGVIALLAVLIVILFLVKRKRKVEPGPVMARGESVNNTSNDDVVDDNGR